MKLVPYILTALLFSLCLYLAYKSLETIQAISHRLDRANVEYQFVVTDSMITVFDHNRYVGTVKLQGELDSLIVSDNQ